MIPIDLVVNGKPVARQVEPRESLLDFLREQLSLTGSHVGCEHGACGACTVEIDGTVVRSCLTLAVMGDGCEIRTIEGTRDDAGMNVIRRHFHEKHALQCGFCTPGMLMAAQDIIARFPKLDADVVRAQLSGHICRCTGYGNIIAAIVAASEELKG